MSGSSEGYSYSGEYSYSDDYSYSGAYSYSEDYSYPSYSYSESNATDSLAEARPKGTARAAAPPRTPPKATHLGGKGTGSKVAPPIPQRLPAGTTGTPAAKPPAEARRESSATDGSYSYDYSDYYGSYSGSYDSYSTYSGSYSASETASAPKKKSSAAMTSMDQVSKGKAKASAQDSVDYSYSTYDYSDYGDYGTYDYSEDSYEVSLDPRKRRQQDGGARKGRAPTDSYSYSDEYSYDETSAYGYSESTTAVDHAATRPPASKKPPVVPRPGTTGALAASPKQGTSDEYSYSSDAYYYDSYDGSYTGDYSYSSYYDSSSARTAPGKDGGVNRQHGGRKDADSESYYYSSDSYSYPEYYSYSTSGNEETYSYTYTDDDEKNQRTSTTRVGTTGSYDSYYYDSYSSGTRSDSSYYSSTSASTLRVEKETPSSTTSSYDYTSESLSDSATSSSALGEEKEPREVLVLRTPTTDVPRAPPAPKRCFVPARSPDDAIHVFLEKLAEVQAAYEESKQRRDPLPSDVLVSPLPPGSDERRSQGGADPVSEVQQQPPSTGTEAGAPLSAEEEGESAKTLAKRKKEAEKQRKAAEKQQKAKAAEAEKAEKRRQKEEEKKRKAAARKQAKAPPQETEEKAEPRTPAGYYSARSVRMALSALELAHVERRDVLKNTPTPTARETLAGILETCMTARVKERAAQAFLAHDTYRSGEIPLTTVGDVLRRLGVVRSPVMGGIRINVDAAETRKQPELVMTVEVQRPPLEGDGAAEGVPAALWDVHAIPVCRIVRENVAAKQPTPVKWHEGNIYMGKHCVCRGVPSEADFQRLKSYIEAATYLCVLTELYTVSGDERASTAGATVLYPHLLRGLLLLTPHTEGRKALYLHCLFRNVYQPMGRLAAYAEEKKLPVMFHGKEAVESRLHTTTDSVEKRRRNVMPATLPDLSALTPVAGLERGTVAVDSPSGDTTVTFVLQKVRVADAVPSTARCFCLVSAVTTDNVFLPAIEVPVVAVRPSSKKGQDHTWTFVDKHHPKESVAAIFAGPSTDRIYVECCYETEETLCVGEEESATPASEHTASSAAAPQTVRTVWCAGYAVLEVANAKTATIPVKEGSLLLDENASQSPSGVLVPGSSSVSGALTEVAEPATVKPKRGLFACLGGRRREGKKGATKVAKAPSSATEMKIEILKNDPKLLPKPHEMPRRYLLLARHATVVPLLRTAIYMTGRRCAHAPQALRQQYIKRAFTVAASSVLLDQLDQLWKYKRSQFEKTQADDREYHYQQIMLCATTIAAMNSLTTKERGQFAEMAIKNKPIQQAFDSDAPMQPVVL